MNNILKNFAAYLNTLNIHYDILPRNNNIMRLATTLENNSSVMINILIIFDDQNSRDTQILVYGLGKTNGVVTLNIMQKINELNARYRWFKLYIENSDVGAIVMSTDAAIKGDSNNQLTELIYRAFKVADECYPQIMKAIWA